MMQSDEFEGAYESWRSVLEDAEADFVASLIEDELGALDVEVEVSDFG